MDLFIKFFEEPSLIEVEREFNAWSKGKNYWVKDTTLLPRKTTFILTVQYCDKSQDKQVPARKKR